MEEEEGRSSAVARHRLSASRSATAERDLTAPSASNVHLTGARPGDDIIVDADNHASVGGSHGAIEPPRDDSNYFFGAQKSVKDRGPEDGRTPQEALEIMVEMAERRVSLPAIQSILRGVGGAMFSIAGYYLSVTITSYPDIPEVVGFLVFPSGFILVHILSQELVTSNVVILCCGMRAKKINILQAMKNLALVFLGNFIGAMAFVGYVIITRSVGGGVDLHFQNRFLFEAHSMVSHSLGGAQGWIAALIQGIFGNWCVCMGLFLAVCAGTTTLQMLLFALPMVVLRSLAGEHIIISLGCMPTALILIALGTVQEDVEPGQEPIITLTNAVLWNFIPVILGNLLGGVLLSMQFWFNFATPQLKAAAKARAERKLSRHSTQ